MDVQRRAHPAQAQQYIAAQDGTGLQETIDWAISEGAQVTYMGAVPVLEPTATVRFNPSIPAYNVAVVPGDWVVKDHDGLWSVLKPEVYDFFYEAVPE